MESIWKNFQTKESREILTGTHQRKVVVIGAGMAGILTAYLLQEAGVEVMVLEANTIASGQTAGTTAKITSQHGMIYRYLIEKFGFKQAKQYATANEEAIKKFADIIQQEKIDCDFRFCNSYLYATEGVGAEHRRRQLKKEIKVAKSLGIGADFTERTELPFSVAGAEVFMNQAIFHPLKFLSHITKKLEIYEHSRVLDIKDNCVFTKEGLVEAEAIVFACHYPWLITPGYYFLRMHQERSYIMAFEQAKTIRGIYRDMDKDGLSFRSYDKYLLVGGVGHRTGEPHKTHNYEKLKKKTEKFYKNAKAVACWSAQDCITLDRVPYIGHLTSTIPNWYVATGFGKWGMTGSMVSAMIIRDMILGKVHPYEEIFSPQRLDLSIVMPQLFGNTGSAIKNLSKRILFFPLEGTKSVGCGEGKIVCYQGKKAGIYKDVDGTVYAVDIGCKHMGCQLSWNPEEKTWDCPCHGSRYDYKGNLLNGPAQK